MLGILLRAVAVIRTYMYTSFLAGVPPPATYNEAMDQEPPEREAFTGLPQIQEEEAREALLGFVAEHCCYGKGAALDLKFTELIHSSAFHVSIICDIIFNIHIEKSSVQQERGAQKSCLVF